jgi:ATP-dependent DNA helicase PIF1
MFITGPGGAGKSYLIRKIKDDLEAREQKHAVCALTGCAAVLLNCCAKTIHSWAGIGLANGADQEIVDKALRNKKANTNWKTTRTLIIDEVSMMSMKIFDVLNKIGQSSRRNYAQPFGGIQVIFIGDFFQLPPVGKPYEPESSMYCFQSANWFKTFSLQNHVVLKTLFRQRDPEFVKVLQEVRMGVLSAESCEALDSRAKAKFESDDPSVVPTKLFPRNADADRVNQTMYARIAEEEHKYPIVKKYNILHYDDDSLPIPPDVMLRCSSLTPDEVEVQLDLHIENSKVCKELMLKKGALVMCLANLDTENGICNGSQGVIVGFERLPLALLKTTNQRVYGNSSSLDETIECPVVRFLNGITMRIAPRLYQHGDFPKYGVVQYPLRLAWAFTIHKSQGITLDIAEMDLGSNVFASGQSYVGLSRVKTLDGLYLSSFNPRKIKTDPIVLEFYRMIPEC